MPLQRRLPKGGFHSRTSAYYDEIRLHELNLVDAEIITLESLKAAGLLRNDVLTVKIIFSGSVDKAVKVKGLRVTKGARAAIESAGGSIED